MPTADATGPKSARYKKKRQQILDSAGARINEQGISSLSLTELARHVDLDSKSIPYYFRRKEDLAAACFEMSLDRLEGCVAAAVAGETRVACVDLFFAEQFQQLARIRAGEIPEVARLTEMRSLKDPDRARLLGRYIALYRQLRSCFDDGDDSFSRAAATIRAHILMETSLWLTFWIGGYGLQDFPRVERRLCEILQKGILPATKSWQDHCADQAQDESDYESDAMRRFLAAATHLISSRGYRGASVESIAAELRVTKGSFYHHLRAKDDLIIDCYRRSLRTVERAQLAAITCASSGQDQIAQSACALLQVQFGGDVPLLRSVALQALPQTMRARLLDEVNVVVRRFAGMVVDGVSDGSIRPVDPMIASQVVMSLINAAYELRYLNERLPEAWVREMYAAVMLEGLHAVAPSQPRVAGTPSSKPSDAHRAKA